MMGQMNTRRLEELGGKKYNYVSADSGKKEYLSTCPAPLALSLKSTYFVSRSFGRSVALNSLSSPTYST